MGVVRLGKLALRWCFECNLPILESRECGLCKGETKPVELTPPGDVRPAFAQDLVLVRETLDTQFGQGCGDALIPQGKIVILNKTPSLDRMDEVIIDGKVLGALRYDPGLGFKFVLRMHGAQSIEGILTENWVIVDVGAVEPIRGGANALGVGITSAYQDIVPGEEVVVLGPEKRAIAVGIAKKHGKDMVGKKGVAVKTRWYGQDQVHALPSGQTWQDVISANAWFFEEKVSEAVTFLRKAAYEEDKEVVVSFSGGKDSLATLLLALDAGLRPRILFVDTGLEFDETREHVEDIAETFGLELLKEDAEDAFWRNVPNFGPPGKDFRWCCKTCKLGPTVRLIKRHFPDGVVSLIGQRAYESEPRARKGRRWRNPWVPGQLGISLIQDWTALHVWLYIFKKGVPYNVWYERGLERIGCWLCPASDIADLEIVERHFPGYERWRRFLMEHAQSNSYPQEWLEFGLWRWKKLPRGIAEFVESKGIEFKTKKEPVKKDEKGQLKFYSAEGYQPCQGGISIEGMFNRSLDMKRVSNLMNILGEFDYDGKTDSCSMLDADIFGEGGVAVRGRNLKEAKKLMSWLRDTIIRAHLCVGCGICTGRCDQDALQVDGQVNVDEEKCLHCGECLGPCPVIGYGNREFEF